jgi:hypothetical protein
LGGSDTCDLDGQLEIIEASNVALRPAAHRQPTLAVIRPSLLAAASAYQPSGANCAPRPHRP